MANPFGKIIQNGVEYNVSPYAHKIEVTSISNDTYESVLTRLYNALKEKTSNFKTIKDAKLVIYSSSGDAHNILISIKESEIKFATMLISSNGCAFNSYTVSNACKFERGLITPDGTFRYFDISNTQITATNTFTLYYS